MYSSRPVSVASSLPSVFPLTGYTSTTIRVGIYNLRHHHPQSPTIHPSLVVLCSPNRYFRMTNAWYNPHNQQDVGHPMQHVSRGTSFAYCHSLPHRFRPHQTIPVQLGQGKSLLNRMWPTSFRVALVQFVQGPVTTIKNTRTHGLP